MACQAYFNRPRPFFEGSSFVLFIFSNAYFAYFINQNHKTCGYFAELSTLEFVFDFNNKNAPVSYISHEKINIILVFPLHDNAPEVINFSNTTKSGVDTTYQVCATYNVSRNIKL